MATRGGGRPRGSSTATSWPRSPPTTRPSRKTRPSSHVAQDLARFCARPDGWRDEVRAQELSATAADVRSLAALADENAPEGVCVFGGRNAIEASGVAFDSVTELC